MAQCMISSLKDDQDDMAQDGEMTNAAKVTAMSNISDASAKKTECCKDFMSTLQAAIQSTNSPSLVPTGKLLIQNDDQSWGDKGNGIPMSQGNGNGKDKVTEADLESFAAYERLCSSHSQADKASLSNYFKPQHPCHVCKGLYPTWSHLRRHLQTHTSYRPYKCHSCEKSFRNYSKLKRHLLTHTGVKPYKCPVCSKAVSRHEHLKRHLLVHSEQRPYKCSICDYSARRIDSVKTHQRNKHKEDEAMQILFMGSVLDESRVLELNQHDTDTMSRNTSAGEVRPKRSHKRKKAKPSTGDPVPTAPLQESSVELELKKREQIASEMLGMMAGHSSVPVTNCGTDPKGIEMTQGGQFSHDQHQAVMAASALCQAKMVGDVGRDMLSSELCKSESANGKQLQATENDNKTAVSHIQLFPQTPQLLPQHHIAPSISLPNTTANDMPFHNHQTSTALSTADQQCALLGSEANMKSSNPQHDRQVSAQSTIVSTSVLQTSSAMDNVARQQSSAGRTDMNPGHPLDQSFPIALLGRQKQSQLMANTYNAPLLHDTDSMKLKTKLWDSGGQLQQPAPQMSTQQQQPNTNIVAAAYTGGYAGFPPFFGQAMSPQDAFIANRYFMPPENTSMAAAAAAFEMQNSAFYMSRQHPSAASPAAISDTMPDTVPQIPEFFRKRIRQGCEQLNKLTHSPTPTASHENTDSNF